MVTAMRETEQDYRPTSVASMHVLRCSCCRRVLAHVRLAPGSIVEIKCRSCGTVNALRTGT